MPIMKSEASRHQPMAMPCTRSNICQRVMAATSTMPNTPNAAAIHQSFACESAVSICRFFSASRKRNARMPAVMTT